MDDVQDGAKRRRGEQSLHQAVGVPQALNAATSLYFLPFSLLQDLRLPPETELTLHRKMADAMLACCHGQSLDLGVCIDRIPIESLRAFVEAATEWKTGGLMGLAAEFGAIVGQAADDAAVAARRLGTSIGVVLQMLNDLSELCETDDDDDWGLEDLRQRRATWIWVWTAEAVAEPQWNSLVDRLLASTCVSLGESALRSLARDLFEIVESRGREEINRRLRASLNVWRDEFADAYDLEPLLAEIGRLERSYAR
jgi:geranylgeranyl diphosphate synthase type I